MTVCKRKAKYHRVQRRCVFLLEHQNPSKTSEKMGFFDRVKVSLHILLTENQRQPSVTLPATFRAPARTWLAVIDFQNGEQQR